MLPIRDEENRPGAVPAVIIMGLIGLNTAVWLYQWWLSMAPDGGQQFHRFILQYGAVPAQIRFWPDPQLTGLFTSMFLHGGWLHLIFNMLFLYIFGDNMEDLFGAGGFFAFYITCGLTAAAVQVVLAPHSAVPIIGASGAIAGVLGGYLRVFSKNRIRTLYVLFLFPFMRAGVFFLRAGWYLVFWIALQFLGGDTAVAYGAHIGGFAAGFILATVWPKRRQALAYYQGLHQWR